MKAWKVGAIVLALGLLAGIFFAGYYLSQGSAYDRGYEAGYDSGYDLGFDDGFDAGSWEVEGDIDIELPIEKIRRGKRTHEYYLTIPPDPETGSHKWHQEWIDTYDKVIEVLEQVKH